MIKKVIRKSASTLLPPGTSRRAKVASVARKVGLIGGPGDIAYAEWVERYEPFTWAETKELKDNPLISIIVPAFNTPNKYLMPMVYSVVNQTYQNWELVLVNASTKAKYKKAINQCPAIDNRIKVVDLADNRGIAGNTNAGIDNADGEYIALLDHDDILQTQALFEVASEINRSETKPQIIYSDEDKVTADGEYRFDPFFKPDWSPQILRHVNYINHFCVIEKQLIKKIKGYRTGFDGAQDYDLFLRLVDEKPQVAHVPKILYHWRTASNSTANDFSKKKSIVDRGIKAIEDSMERNGQSGKVKHIEKQPGFYNPFYDTKKSDRVCLLVLPSDNVKQYEYLINSIAASLPNNINIDLAIMEGPKYLGLGKLAGNIKLIKYSSSTKSGAVKQVLNDTKATIFGVIGSAVIPRTKDKKWLAKMSGLISQVDSIGIASPIVLSPILSNLKVIKRAGLVNHQGKTVSLFQGLPLGQNSLIGNTIWGRNVDSLDSGVWFMRREIVESYLTEERSYVGFNLAPSVFKSLIDKGQEVVMYPFAKMEYRGELHVPKNSQGSLNQNISIGAQELTIPQGFNVPPEAS
ncbi:MAG: glycosyltransferase [Candidatus Saccharibacteria bacterium]